MILDSSIDLVRESLVLMMTLSAPVLGAALAVGLVISVLQAVTQVQEQTLTFVPKILVMTAVAVLATPWILSMLMEFSVRMFSGMP
ncbi:flagellar biosynthesis protein FliQ [Phycisphaera mikurensis]|uniref:Flagellar biosynthetic protein FliQ n=1 Tax=Phycisphaera mikurensis (strain NBRC 102666 / KCTC 22515 / FYK2301M01) TaxID=1142394 RepID=I0IGX2_PHYMF|nr:flagellar biosynthesis protein FliQ [Phycisphaera mikurensis]MBB6440767.1 flagellar biosynthetic protein FliQ [Phycisphaera mikurensis]BAM04510.1 flagellar biosynthesis pathway component FliQ [Phycisphaera mikurensis NBRC 102666]